VLSASVNTLRNSFSWKRRIESRQSTTHPALKTPGPIARRIFSGFTHRTTTKHHWELAAFLQSNGVQDKSS
jgi:hypothetical protein